MKKLTFLFLAFGLSLSAQAQQKCAHLNSGNLLEGLPEVKVAEEKLVKYQDSLATKGQQMYEQFEVAYKAYIEEANKGNFTPIQAKQKEEGLQKQQQNIEAYRGEVEEKLTIRRQAYLKPILDRVDETIKSVGKEGNYTFIFDSSTGGMLFAQDTEDITAIVKAKLGIK